MGSLTFMVSKFILLKMLLSNNLRPNLPALIISITGCRTYKCCWWSFFVRNIITTIFNIFPLPWSMTININNPIPVNLDSSIETCFSIRFIWSPVCYHDGCSILPFQGRLIVVSIILRYCLRVPTLINPYSHSPPPPSEHHKRQCVGKYAIAY